MYVIDFMLLIIHVSFAPCIIRSGLTASNQKLGRTANSRGLHLQTVKELLTEIIASNIPYSIQEAYQKW